MDPCIREREKIPELVARATESYCGKASGSSSVKDNVVGSFDIVTDADERAQGILIDGLAELFPDDLIIAEEGREAQLTEARTWVIDPIDGTLNYKRGTPLFGTQMALMVDKKPVFSIINLPALGEVYIADRVKGASMNGVQLKQTASRPLSECIVSTGDFSRKKVIWRDKHEEIIGAMRDEVARVRMMGAACTDFAFLAAGRIDIHLRFANKLWDFMPGMFLAEMSGTYTDQAMLDETGLLVMSGSRAESEEFRSKVLSRIDFTGSK